MNRYSSYKDSGVEWGIKIPNNWSITKLKYLGLLYGGLTGKSGSDFNNDENPSNKPYIPYTNIYRNTYISKNHFDYVSIIGDEKQNLVKKFDMFFLMSSETFQDLGKSCILIEDVDELYLNSFCKGFRLTTSKLNPLFLNYQLLGKLHRELISIEGKGFTRINLRQEKVQNLPIFVPPLQEQEQIVAYLDKKTAIVDTLIASKEQKINLLKEKRTALINHTFTKGLDPNVKLKHSGVEWIGEIPVHWDVKKLKHLTLIISKGTTPSTVGREISDEGEIRYLKAENIKENEVTSIPAFYIDLETNESIKRSTLLEGDILFVIAGATIGKVAILKKELTPANTNQAISFIRLNNLGTRLHNLL